MHIHMYIYIYIELYSPLASWLYTSCVEGWLSWPGSVADKLASRAAASSMANW